MFPDPDTRETLGRLARWIVLPGAVALAIAAVAVQVGAFEHTVAAGRSWSVTPDVIARAGGNWLVLRIYGDPPLRPGVAGFYWYRPDDTLREPYYQQQTVYYGIPEGVPPGRLPVRNVVNPYACFAPGVGCCSAYAYERGTTVAVLDARTLLATDPDGRLARDVRDRFSERADALPLAQLTATDYPLAYLVPVPLSDYEHARDILRQAPPGAALAAADRHAMAATAEEIVGRLDRISRRLAAPPILLTDDADLAAVVRHAQFPVLLVNAETAPPAPGADVPSWNAAAAYLAGQ